MFRLSSPEKAPLVSSIVPEMSLWSSSLQRQRERSSTSCLPGLDSSYSPWWGRAGTMNISTSPHTWYTNQTAPLCNSASKVQEGGGGHKQYNSSIILKKQKDKLYYNPCLLRLKLHPVDSKTGGQCEKSGMRQIACNCLKCSGNFKSSNNKNQFHLKFWKFPSAQCEWIAR